MLLKSYRFIAAALLFAASSLLPAQARPNFSGAWTLNASKSDFGAMPKPANRTDKITHVGVAITDSFTQSSPKGDVTAIMKYLTDGKETVSDLHGNQVRYTAKWEGDELVIEGKTQLNGAGVTLTDRWSLSPDKKTLTIQRHVNSPMGETEQRIVLDKQ